MAIEVTMRHSDVKIESLKEYAEARMEKLQERFPKVTSINIVNDVGAKEFSESAKSVIDTAAARAERQLLRMRVKARKGTVRKQRAASVKN